MRKLRILGVLVVLIGVAVQFWYWDSDPPAVTFPSGEVIGKKSRLVITFSDRGRGLENTEVLLRQGEVEKVLSVESFPGLKWPWESSSATSTMTLADWEGHGLTDGPFELVAKATDQRNLWLFNRQTEVISALRFDTRPPRIEVLSRQHYLRQGGSEAALYRVNERGASGVQVGENRFMGYPLPSQGEGVFIVLFAMADDQDVDNPIFAWAEDQAGNVGRTNFSCKVFEQRFRHRQFNISDRFIASVTPEVLANSPGWSEAESPAETFLKINGDMRRENNNRIAEIGRNSRPEALWSEPFLQLSNSQVESVFAERRSYFYRGEKFDQQTHLGFDLASLAKSSVEASNSGVVAFADYLGIYGNTVILDHGLGLFSLYGHLSVVDVEVGESVSRGQSLGLTGQTGLASGDHLHFSMVLQGVQVNPVEWWDPEWIKNRVLSKLNSPALE